MNNTQKAVTSSCLQVGRQVVCSTEVFTFQYIPILAFVYVLLSSVKWRKKKQSRKITTKVSQISQLHPPSNFHNLTPASFPPTSDPLQPIGLFLPQPQPPGTATFHSVITKSSLSCLAARSVQGPQTLGGRKLPQVKAL